MSETAVGAKDSGLGAAVGSGSPFRVAAELLRRFGVLTVLCGFLIWRVDGWVSDMRDTNKATTEAFQKMAVDNAKLVQENTSQSRQTQTAIEKFSEQTTTNQRSMERVLDRLERSSSMMKVGPRAPVIE